MKTLENILQEYFGFDGKVDGPEWCKACGRLTELLYDVGTLTNTRVESIVERLDEIDSRDGEVLF